MKGLMRGIVVAGCVAGLVVSFGARVEARPQYKKLFDSTYEKVAKDNKTTCFVCHEEGEGKTKKDHNNYGKAMVEKGKIGKNEKDEDKIKEAFTKTEPEKSAIKDKTFGDLLKDGKLPASK